MDQGGAQGVREVSPRCADNHTPRFDDCRRGRQGGYAKPMKGLGPGVLEIALAYRSDAYRAVYAVTLGEDIWVVRAFQKKSTRGIETPKREIDLIHARIGQLKEQLR